MATPTRTHCTPTHDPRWVTHTPANPYLWHQWLSVSLFECVIVKCMQHTQAAMIFKICAFLLDCLSGEASNVWLFDQQIWMEYTTRLILITNTGVCPPAYMSSKMLITREHLTADASMKVTWHVSHVQVTEETYSWLSFLLLCKWNTRDVVQVWCKENE